MGNPQIYVVGKTKEQIIRFADRFATLWWGPAASATPITRLRAHRYVSRITANLGPADDNFLGQCTEDLASVCCGGVVMFEQEIEFEQKRSGIVPLLLVVALILAVVGVAGYELKESSKVLSVPEAANVAIRVLQVQGPATVKFHVGKLVSSVADKPTDPHYRLLEKAGVLKLVRQGKSYDSPTLVTLTPKGEELLAQIPGVKKSHEKDGTEAYVVPLAERRLVDVPRVTMTGAGRATMEYSWRWEPNALGESFDVGGVLLQTFNTWDRANLINKYGAEFYHQAPTKVVMALVRTGKGWLTPTD
jgi:hypothetical protein